MTNDKIAPYLQSETARQQLYKRTLIVILCSQIFGGAGLAAGITVGALLAKDMLGTDSVTGLPAALFTLGSALAAYIVGRVSQKYGRRYGLASGFFVGSLGALGVVVAGAIDNIALLFIALFLYGAGTATNLQARYAGTDLATDKQRATATSIALVATTFGAVAGPNLATTMGKVAESFALPALVGPFILAAAAYALAGAILFIFLRPDPLLVARAIALYNTANKTVKAEMTMDKKQMMRMGIIVGAIVLVLTQVIMTSIMTMTPVHMLHHGSHLNAVGIVIGLHVAAMYLPSLGTGLLVDKVGRTFVALAASMTLAVAGICAAFAPGDSLLWLVVALMLLGLGWNFGLISGTAIIIDSTTIHNRAKVQGSVDVAVALGGSFGSVVSGVVVAFSSYATLGFIGMTFALFVIPVVLWGYKAKRVA
ncbi:MFS transporter [Metasolibacillus meyeri]|uniref:MFS transporter n=1 Tax=Metasolibacillus meyeri TaxID=1071052 RepID=UPI000D326A9E|nr:MFS transporter [Metasolibacillus meyeri]